MPSGLFSWLPRHIDSLRLASCSTSLSRNYQDFSYFSPTQGGSSAHRSCLRRAPLTSTSPVAVGRPVTTGGGSGSIPPLKEIVEKLRTELGLNEEMPMAQLVDWAVDELGAEVEKGAPLIKKAEAAGGALMGN